MGFPTCACVGEPHGHRHVLVDAVFFGVSKIREVKDQESEFPDLDVMKLLIDRSRNNF